MAQNQLGSRLIQPTAAQAAGYPGRGVWAGLIQVTAYLGRESVR